MPIPSEVKRIDLAVTEGIPTIKSVINAIVSELEVEQIYLAIETKEQNKHFLDYIFDVFEGVDIVYVSHKRLKEMTKDCVAIVRTGECVPFSNIILQSGTFF